MVVLKFWEVKAVVLFLEFIVSGYNVVVGMKTRKRKVYRFKILIGIIFSVLRLFVGFFRILFGRLGLGCE